MRFTFDKGIGSNTGRWLSFHIGPGAGYIRGTDATRPFWRKVEAVGFIGRFLALGHTLRVWCGPTYWNWFNFRNTLRGNAAQRRRFSRGSGARDTYALVSFR